MTRRGCGGWGVVAGGGGRREDEKMMTTTTTLMTTIPPCINKRAMALAFSTMHDSFPSFLRCFIPVVIFFVLFNPLLSSLVQRLVHHDKLIRFCWILVVLYGHFGRESRGGGGVGGVVWWGREVGLALDFALSSLSLSSEEGRGGWGLVGTLCWAGDGGGCVEMGGCLRAVFSLEVACVVVCVSPVLCLV